MSATSKPTAKRLGKVAAVVSSQAGRLDGRAWRDVARATALGKKNDAYSVEIHGVRIVFWRSVNNPSKDTKKGGAVHTQTNRQRDEPASAPAERMQQQPNSAQRRSARRMQAYILAQGSGQVRAASTSAPAGPPAAEPSQVSPDVRMGDATTAIVETTGQRRKRAASESRVPAPATKPGAGAAAQQQRRRVASPPKLATQPTPQPSRAGPTRPPPPQVATVEYTSFSRCSSCWGYEQGKSRMGKHLCIPPRCHDPRYFIEIVPRSELRKGETPGQPCSGPKG